MDTNINNVLDQIAELRLRISKEYESKNSLELKSQVLVTDSWIDFLKIILGSFTSLLITLVTIISTTQTSIVLTKKLETAVFIVLILVLITILLLFYVASQKVKMLGNVTTLIQKEKLSQINALFDMLEPRGKKVTRTLDEALDICNKAIESGQLSKNEKDFFELIKLKIEKRRSKTQ